MKIIACTFIAVTIYCGIFVRNGYTDFVLTVDDMKCLRNISNSIIVFCGYDQLSICVSSIRNAHTAEYPAIDVMLTFSFDENLETQASRFQSTLKSQKIGMIWLDAIPAFDYSSEHSAEYFVDFMIRLAKLLSQWTSVGLRTQIDDWKQYTNNSLNVSQQIPLLAYTGNTDKNFNDFIPFGGWTKPTMKRLGNEAPSACETSYMLEYY